MYCVLLGVGLLFSISSHFKLRVNIIPFAIIVIALISTIYHFHYHLNNEVHWFYSKAARFLSTFFLGACLYIIKDHIVLSKRALVGCGLFLLMALLFNKDVFYVFFTLISPYIILCVAYLPKGKILQYNKLGDYSYGTYIYAWPIQQTLAITFVGIQPVEMMFATFILTLLFAITSWHLIEKPTMKLKRYYT
jgi:peptidoglycan/LPS O-acetylase OafA/YrhL